MRRFRKLTALAVAAGILYNSWLLGYWLNPAVARSGLASELEGLHQPYNWLFIACDVATGLLVTLVCWLLWTDIGDSKRKDYSGTVLAGLLAFGIGTIVDTLLPMSCEPSLQRCPSFTHDYVLLAHGIFSILAAVGLFASLALLWWNDRRSRLLSTLMAGYIIFGLTTLIQVVTPSNGNWSQHYYLVLCGVWLALVPYAISRRFAAQPPQTPIGPAKLDN